MTDRWPQFDIKRDIETVNAGGFFCQACVVGKPLDDISPDPRYCQGCYDVLVAEADMIVGHVKKDWAPLTAEKTDTSIQGYGGGNLSTVKAKNSKVDKLPSRPPKVKPGPKTLDLPDDLIGELAALGVGSKAISRELAKQGISVSYKTIQRRLRGVPV